MREIEKLPELLSSYLEGPVRCIDYKTTNLTKPGENYGSVLLSVEIKLKNVRENKEETVYAAAKTPPEDEKIQEIFQTSISFVNEAQFYKTVIPTLQAFQKGQGIEDVANYAPNCIAVRYNLNKVDEKVDENAVLLLENLKESGYVTVNRLEGFDLECAELILKKMANFHATAIAVKLQNPEDFESKVKPYLDGVTMEGEGLYKMKQLVADVSEEILLDNSNYGHLIKRTLDALRHSRKSQPREPFATIVHADMWVNNIMLKFEKRRPVDVKFIDFQICSYGSPAADLLFFLFTSVHDYIVTEKLDYLIKFYYDNFIETVENLKCDTALFTYDEFLREIELTANESQFAHCLVMLFPIMRNVQSEEEARQEFDKSKISTRHKDKLGFIVSQFAKKDWI